MTKVLAAIALAASALAVLPGCVPLAVVGAGTTALVAGDRRTTGIYIEDENIEMKILRISGDFNGAHVNATSFNTKVLLTGEAPDEATRTKIENLVKGVASVKEVVNELQIAGNSSLAARGSDSVITTNVKSRMVNNSKVSPLHVKVVTEASTVYLMGLVSQEEGDAAVEVARTTSGVSRVVKVFEYIK